MGKLALAAKITHVPSMYLSELPGKNHGCRQGAIDGHKEISKRCREMGVDTIIVFDTHWLVNSAYHINCADHFEGVYTSNELPHFIRDMTYNYEGNPELGQLIADEALKLGVRAKAHNIPSLKLEYGTLVPMRYMNEDKHFKVVSISAFCTVHDFADSRKLGEAILKAIEQYDGTVAVLASGSLSHRFIDDQRAEEGMNSYTREFDRQMDERVVKLWREGQFKEFCNMLPEYADYCYGEGNMHDTVMLLGMLGWDKYDGKVELLPSCSQALALVRLTLFSRFPRKEKPCRTLSWNVLKIFVKKPAYLSCLPVLTPHWRRRGFFRLGEYVAGHTGSIPGKWLMASTITPLCI